MSSPSVAPPGPLIRDMQESKDETKDTRSSIAVAGPGPQDPLYAAHQKALQAIARNAKIGPWPTTAKDPTTGEPIMLAYYLNAATNLMDASVAKECTQLMIRLLRGAIASIDTKDCTGPVIMVGPEMAGGVIVGQIACLWEPHSSDPCDVQFVYLRKKRKTSGTLQQLEGPNAVTLRTPTSPLAAGIWVDDVLSTGTSMKEGVAQMKEEYNIDIRAAVFLVDRSADRAKESRRVNLNNPIMSNVRASAAFDLAEIDPIVRAAIASNE